MKLYIDGKLRDVYTIKCKCGKEVVFSNCEKKICPNCGKFVFKNKKLEFEYMTKKYQLIERKENGKKV